MRSRDGVDLDHAFEARSQLESAAAYLELHIEQGPVLESLDLPLGVVLGTFGVERHLVRWKGQSAHAGSTPIDRGAMPSPGQRSSRSKCGTSGARGGGLSAPPAESFKPGIVTSVVGRRQLLDQRHLDADSLAAMLADATECSQRFAAEESIEV